MNKINKNIVVLLVLMVTSLKGVVPTAIDVFEDKSLLDTKDALLSNFTLSEIERIYNNLKSSEETATTQPAEPAQKPQERITIPEDYYKVIGATSSESRQQIFAHFQETLAKLYQREEKINNLYGKYLQDPSAALSREDLKYLGIWKPSNQKEIQKAFNNQLDLIDIDRYVIERAAHVILTHKN